MPTYLKMMRFVFQFIRSAMDRDGIALNYVESLGGERDQDSGLWRVKVRDQISGNHQRLKQRYWLTLVVLLSTFRIKPWPKTPSISMSFLREST